ncbi:tetratricopeptide repeat-containing sulfotransferase family protein [Microbulbifer sp. SSSA008]|uniref:tetratricopeptide repeat-containing sulfotransferase family protein n=1 Tax=Microbulbifer sp. SSSA008 TaxID=3243380 RepID=UPI00403A1016
MRNSLQDLSAIARQAAQSFDWQQVLKCSEKILSVDPSEAEGFFLRGLAEKALSRPKDATMSFSKALSANNERYDAAIELAYLLSMNLRNNQAEELLAAHTSQLQNSPRYLDMAATVYMQIGMAEQAWPLYEQANKLQPHIPLFRSNMANCAAHLGKLDIAKNIYRELLNNNTNHQRNHYHLSRLERAKNNLHIEEMKESLKKTNLPPYRNIFMNYAIGKELEDIGEWSKAFTHYKSAGDAAASASQYEVNKDLSLIDKTIDTCSERWLDEDLNNFSKSEDQGTPIFVVGLPRTGSTLIERILTSHTEIDSLGETPFLPSSIREVSGFQPGGELTAEIIESGANVPIKKIASLYFENIKYRNKGNRFFIEKLPYNFLLLGFISKAFPNAKIIHTVRNPMDTCFSIYKQLFTWAYQFSYKLEDLARYYIAHRKLLQHWNKLLGDKIIEVKYENLVLNQKEETSNLLAKLGLDMEESCLEFHTNKSASMTASSIQIRNRINSHSLNKWKKFETHLAPLAKMLKDAKLI